ncbi:class I SAM-dependent DNA methyltransferase [Azospirillum sp.]|uniref:class I SAM-dependent DNA methyltransferase n=1 Tax=Azospirillum sp. TaxID=34012 RepID=UPI003D74C8E9
MTDPFGDDYAAAYDALYRDKDYEAECDLIERLLDAHGAGGPRRLLDLGCGTGNHAIPLARRGHAVVGVDRSAPMLAQARAKGAHTPSPPEFHLGDLRDIDLGRRFDAVVMMFAVLGYQHGNVDLLAALGMVRRHLEPGGLFVFDVWNGLAVLNDRPGQRVRTVPTAGGRIVRTTDSRLDVVRQLCHVRFGLMRIEGDRIASEGEEVHTMRFFFPQELDLALGAAGLRLLDLRRFPDGEAPADEQAWTVVGVARADP